MLTRSLFLCFLLAFSLNHVQASLGGKYELWPKLQHNSLSICSQILKELQNLNFELLQRNLITDGDAADIPANYYEGEMFLKMRTKSWRIMTALDIVQTYIRESLCRAGKMAV